VGRHRKQALAGYGLEERGYGWIFADRFPIAVVQTRAPQLGVIGRKTQWLDQM
jgi:hypothetical protein